MLLFSVIACASSDALTGPFSMEDGAHVEAGGGDDSADNGSTGGVDSGGGEDDADTDDDDDTGTPDDGLLHQTPGSLHLPNIEARNIVILHVDTMRADHLKQYGYARSTLPRLSARPWLAVDGEVAASSWTLPSTTSFFTGLDVRHHDVRYVDHAQPNKWLTATTFATRVNDAGYATGLFSGNMNVNKNTGITGGFDTEVLIPKEHRSNEINSRDLVDKALAWVDAIPDDQPFMMHVQPMDLHSPLAPPTAYAGTWAVDVPFQTEGSILTGQEGEIKALLQGSRDAAARARVLSAVNAVYDESMLGLDESLDMLLLGLELRGVLDDTVVVLTADHGEEFDDAGDLTLGHGGNLRESTIRLPLLILAPDLAPAKITCRMRNYDVWPTIFAAMGLGVPAGLDGVDLAEGCVDTASASLWDMSGKLMVVATTGSRSKLTSDCPSGGIRAGTDLNADYTPSEAEDPDGILDAPEMEAALTNDIANIEADNGGSWCH